MLNSSHKDTPRENVICQHEWLVLLILAGVNFTHIMDFMIIMPLGPQFMRLFSISPGQFSLLVSAYTLAAGLSGFFAAFYIDRFDRKYALLSLYIGFCIATVLCAIAPNYWLLLLARAVAGAFGGVLGAIIFAIIGDVIPEQRRGTATGTVMAAFSFAAVAGVPLGLFLANHFSWRAPFLFLAMLATLIWVVAWRTMPNINKHISPQSPSGILARLSNIFLQRNHQRAFLLTATVTLAGFTVIPFLSPYMVANVGITELQLPYIYFYGGLATLFTSRFIGKLADRYGKQKIFIIVACISIIPIGVVTHLPQTPLIPTIIMTTLFMVFVSGRFVPAMALITSSVLPRYRGSFMSFNASIQQLAAGLASFISGLVVTKAGNGTLINYDVVGNIAIVATIICLFLASRLQIIKE